MESMMLVGRALIKILAVIVITANNHINTTNIYTKVMKPTELQHTEKKLLLLTKQQKASLKTLESYGVNVSHFIREAIKEKLSRDWKGIKDKKDKIRLPF